MIGGANELVLTEDIFREFAQEDIFEHCGLSVSIGNLLTNPFRDDHEPRCHFGWYNGILIFYDFTGFFGSVGVTSLQLLKFLKPHLDTNQKILEYLRKNIKSRSSSLTPQYSKTEIQIKISSLPFPKTHYLDMFPASFLYKENVHYVGDYWCNTKTDSILRRNRFYNPKGFHIYGFFFDHSKHIKLYAPNAEPKFYTNCTSNDIWGEDCLYYPTSDILLITKGGKDYITLKYFTEFDVIAVQSEYDMLSESTIELIKENYRAVYIVFDPDPTGIQQVAKWIPFGFKIIQYQPEIGDSFDYLTKKGPEFLIKTIQENL